MLPDAFYHFKNLLNFLLPLSADALHVHVGLGLFIAVLTLMKDKPQRFVVAFGAVLAICLAGEILDVLYDYHAGNPLRWRNSMKDIVNTMLWPTIWTAASMRQTWRSSTDSVVRAGVGLSASIGLVNRAK